MPRRDSERHWGPNVAKIPIAGGIGIVIGIGLMIGFLGSVPELRLWLFTALPLGIVLGIVIHFLRR